MTEPPIPAGQARLARRDLLAAGLIAAASPAAAEPTPATPRRSPIVELRQYTCHGGRRDELISLFEREFIESQAAVGAQVIGTFRDRDDPDRFVWLRGFETMPQRGQALSAFYSGPVWQAHRNAANVTMLDSDNVLLLHPTETGGGFAPQPPRAEASGELLAFIHYLTDATLPPFARFFEATARSQIAAAGEVLATFVSETGRNTFPGLPVRETDRVFVWVARPGAAGESAFLEHWRQRTGWRNGVEESLLPAFMRKPEVLRLEATARSLLR